MGVQVPLTAPFQGRRVTRSVLLFGMWLSLVERCVRDAKAAGSNPVIPTSQTRHNKPGFFDFDTAIGA
jgi:hypothetical protein